TFRCRVDAISLQHIGYGSPPHRMLQVSQRALNARVSPAWVLLRHANNQIGDLAHEARTPRPAPFAEVPLFVRPAAYATASAYRAKPAYRVPAAPCARLLSPSEQVAPFLHR